MPSPRYKMTEPVPTSQLNKEVSLSSAALSAQCESGDPRCITSHRDHIGSARDECRDNHGSLTSAENASRSSTTSRRLQDEIVGPSEGFDERATKVPKPLTILDLASLVFNKMVGTGIFTVPGHVLAATANKRISIGLWVAGSLYTALCLTAYLELGAQFPYDGGELIYLDRTLRPGLMWTMAFAMFFVTIANTSGNAIAFARFVMVAALPLKTSLDELDSRVVKLIAVSIVSVVCLLHAFSSNLGRFLNKLLALYKFCLLVTVIIASFWAFGDSEEKAGLDDYTLRDAKKTDTRTKLGAGVLVLYSFTGWENANYVAGEIRNSDSGESSFALPIGAYSAVAVVSVLYILVTVSYYLAFTYENIINSLDLGMARNLGPLAFKPKGVSLDVLFALSAFGNLIAVVYTSSRVKQAIARQRLLPFWKYLEKDEDTPKGGLFLHWLFTTIMILAAPAGPDGYSFVVGLYTYGQVVIVTFAVIGLLIFLWQRARNRKADGLQEPFWTTNTYLLRSKVATPLLIACIVCANLLVMATAPFQGRKTEDSPNAITGKLWPAVTFSIFSGGIFCWIVLVLLQKSKVSKHLGIEVKVHVNHDDNGTLGQPEQPNSNGLHSAATSGGAPGSQLTVSDDNLAIIGATRTEEALREENIRKEKETLQKARLRKALLEARHDGTNRRLEVKLRGKPQAFAGWLHTKKETLLKQIS